MTGLKSLVICMGLLILAGVALVGYGVSRRPPSGAPPPVAQLPGQPAYFAAELPIPRGGRLEQVAATGDRLVLHFSGGEGDRILLLDTHTGQLAGSVTLVPETH
jgi:hypothetical protein